MTAIPFNISTSSQRFIEFVRMQAQQIFLFLGKIHSPTGKVAQNLEVARLFIDQLEMLQEKTNGNLNSEEVEALNVTLSEVRFAYVQTVSKDSSSSAAVAPSSSLPQTEVKYVEGSMEKKKKFSKNYGS